MDAKEQVKQKYPNAIAQMYRDKMHDKSHWLIWDGMGEKLRLGSGITKTEAWKKALKTISEG